jgi:hypothetical protein
MFKNNRYIPVNFILITSFKVIEMKKVLLFPLLLSSIWLSGLVAVVTSPAAQGANVAQSICEYVAADDKKRMRSFLKTNKLKIRNIFDGIECNGQNILEFAANRGSLDTGELIISKLPKNVIEENLAKLEVNQDLLAKANERIK